MNIPVWVLFLFLVSVIFRLVAIFTIAPAFDEMVQNYMTQDISRLGALPVYFYGQSYMGPIESYLMAPLFLVFGFTYLKARIYYQVFYLCFGMLFLSAARRLFDRRAWIYLVAMLFLPPYSMLFYSSIVGYVEILTLSVLLLFLLLAWSRASSSRHLLACVLGLVFGLGFWSNSLYLVWVPSLLASLWWGVPSFWKEGKPTWLFWGLALGLSPLWIHGLRTGEWLHLATAGGRFAALGEVPEMFYLFLARMKYFLSTFLYDTRSPWESSLVRALSYVPFIFFVVSWGAYVGSFVKSWRSRTAQDKIFFSFMALSPITLALLYSVRSLYRDEGMRFFIPIFIPYAFSVAWAISRLRAPILRGILFALLAGIMCVVSLVSLRWSVRDREILQDIFLELKAKDLHYGIAELNLAYGLNELEKGTVVATPFPADSRYLPLLHLVREKGPQFMILQWDTQLYRKDLEEASGLSRVSVRGYDIFYGESPVLARIVASGPGDKTIS